MPDGGVNALSGLQLCSCRPDKRSAIRRWVLPDGGVNALSGLRLCSYRTDKRSAIRLCVLKPLRLSHAMRVFPLCLKTPFPGH
ncbi:hypothetical protein EGX86_17830 [Citrobacter koseri]|nr:hypothetical protein EGX86_17830 [Citrobacter koseri]